MYRMQKKILAYGGEMMRYEQLKTGDIFADQFGVYIKTDFGAAINLRSGKPAMFEVREEIEKRCCWTCCHYRTGRCANGDIGNVGETVDRLWKCKEWEGLL